jgi:hypothetical protein
MNYVRLNLYKNEALNYIVENKIISFRRSPKAQQDPSLSVAQQVACSAGVLYLTSQTVTEFIYSL